jgi:hypothetical protein
MRQTGWNRIVGLLTMGFMAHLSLVGTDLVCATHAGPHSAMAHSAYGMSAAAMGEMDSGVMQEEAAYASLTLVSASAHASDDAPCQIPSTVHCCDAMTGCALTLAVTKVADARQLPARSEGVAIAAAFAPLSRLTAPEPPPPKA